MYALIPGYPMRRRIPFSAFFLLIVSGALWLTACSGDQPATLPTGIDATASASRGVQSGGGGGAPRCEITAVQQIIQLFEPRDRGRAISGFVHIDEDIRRRGMSDAVTDMFQEWEFTLDRYYAGDLRGGTSADTQTETLAFGRALYCLVGLDGSALTLGTTPLDPDNVVKVVFPSPNDQTVVTGSQHAGVNIPGGTLTQPVTISISLITGTFTFPAGPLNTKLDQYGPFFEFKVVPEQTFNTPVVAAACIQTSNGGSPPSSVDIAHNVGNGIEILPTAPAPFLVCGPTALAPQPSAFELARNGEYGRAIMRLGSSAMHMFTPTPAYALTVGIGGTTKSFSPFGGVDTAAVVRLPANFPSQPQSAAAGSPVASAPSVLVQTANGHTPLGGASVTFTVMSGGGSVGPPTSSTATTTLTLTTDASGLATVPNWTLGVGPANSLTAGASFTLPTSISGLPTTGITAGAGVLVSGNPVTFTGTSTDIVPYQASGYVFLSGPAGIAQGFEQPSYQATSQNGWQTGLAAFGSSNLGQSCPTLVASVGTLWPNVPPPTDMLLRKSYTLPAWWTAGLSVGIAIDNDFQAFVDGVNVTPTSAPGYNPGSGFVQHENCAQRDSFIFPIPAHGGSHVLAIRARDRGTAAYVDTRIRVTP